MMWIKCVMKPVTRILQPRRFYQNRNILKLRDRGMLADIFPGIAANEVTDILNARYQTVYAGFDPTADSLHVGNLLVLMNLLHWQRGGHSIIAVVGGATARIGDPSGKATEREKMKSNLIDGNMRGIEENILMIFDNHEKYFWSSEDKLPKIKILNNEEWYKDKSPVDLIGTVGRHLRMGTLLSRTSVQTRLKSPIGLSFAEFSYQLFQAYDWMHLYENYGCRFQVGGNDQMGNIMSGHDLIHKVYDKSVYGLTVPLITTEMGDKFGKSAGNAIWLSSSKTSPYMFYQFWMRVTDDDVEQFLRMFTFDTVNQIRDLITKHQNRPELRNAQRRLAEQVTLLVHGEKGLRSAQVAAKALYEGDVEEIGQMTLEEVSRVFQGADIVEIIPEPGQTVLDMSLKARCFPTEQDATRIISAGGFYINQKKSVNPSEIINPSAHRLPNNTTLLRVGKKNFYIIKWT